MAPKNDQEPAGKPETKPPAQVQPDAGAAPGAAAGAKPDAEPAAAKVPAVTKTPAEWAAELGHTKKRDRRLPQSLDHIDPAFAVANRLYGWGERAYHFQDPEHAFLITEATYRAALKTAPQFPAVELVADALTPEAAANLQGHEPKRNLKTERAAQEAADAKAAAAKEAAATKEAEAKKGNG